MSSSKRLGTLFTHTELGGTFTIKNHPSSPTPHEKTLAECQTLEHLREAIEAFEGCPLKQDANRTVFADGIPHSPLMIIGEAPGQEEDKQGKPFVGQAGKLLDELLSCIGYTREKNVYITNVIPWRPPDNRKPSKEELSLMLPFLYHHIVLNAPQVLLLVGSVALSTLFPHHPSITKTRGTPLSLVIDPHNYPILATFHPAYLLRNPIKKREVWEDLLTLEDMLKNHKD